MRPILPYMSGVGGLSGPNFYWSSSQNNASNAWNQNVGNGGGPVGFELSELFEAYYSCRVNKRGTRNALAFEIDSETNLVTLWRGLNEGSYRPGRSDAFIVDKPVEREVFAADFRDRVVHHLIINKLNPLFEAEFIHDSYACRAGKGTLFGVRRLQRFIRACSAN